MIGKWQSPIFAGNLVTATQVSSYQGQDKGSVTSDDTDTEEIMEQAKLPEDAQTQVNTDFSQNVDSFFVLYQALNFKHPAFGLMGAGQTNAASKIKPSATNTTHPAILRHSEWSPITQVNEDAMELDTANMWNALGGVKTGPTQQVREAVVLAEQIEEAVVNEETTQNELLPTRVSVRAKQPRRYHAAEEKLRGDTQIVYERLEAQRKNDQIQVRDGKEIYLLKNLLHSSD